MSTLSLVITINGPASTGVTFTPASPFSGSGSSFSASAAVASGVTVGTFSVAPSGWQGVLALSGAQAADFTLSGLKLVTAAALPASSAVTVTATP